MSAKSPKRTGISRLHADAKAPPAKDGDAAAAEAPEGGGWGRWLIGWVLVPALVAGAIFAAGVHLGANGPDRWYTRAATWVADLF